MPQNFGLLGISRSTLTDEEFRDEVFLQNEFLDLSTVPQETQSEFAQLLFYQTINTNRQDDYALVKQRLEAINSRLGTQGNCIFYLSTPPVLYDKIPAFLAQFGLNRQSGSYRRLVIEKPFGYDLASAHALNESLKKNFDEENIYRIDHYLGKETVQNLLVTRFANGIFEPLWNRNYVSHMEITSAEDIGVGSRGGYYDHSGALA